MAKNFNALTNIICLNIRLHLLCVNESKVFSLNFKVFWQWIIIMFFNEFFSHDCIIDNIKTFVTFNKILIVNNSFLKSLAQAARRYKLFNINFLHSLISYLKLFNKRLHKFFRFFIKIVRNVINNFFRNNNLNIDQFKYKN